MEREFQLCPIYTRKASQKVLLSKLNKSSTKENVFSRAVIVFKTVPGLIDFHKGYSGHTFIDGKGTQFRAAVEFAPFQRWVDPTSSKKKQDHRMGTIESGSLAI